MRIGIVTIFRTGNYGGTLQAFALKKAIELNNLGKADIINYSCDSVEGKIDRKFLRNAGVFRTLVAFIEKLYYYPRMRGVNKFIDSYLNGEELDRDQLFSLNDKYEVFLSGSDQIWNPDIQQGDYYYLLDFVIDNYKKRSYASSFGRKSIPDKYVETYQKLLSEYHYISVREEDGAKLVESLTGKKPDVVLDPVLLLSRQQWEFILPKRGLSGRYVFVYQMAHSSLISRVASICGKGLSARVNYVPFPIGGLCRCTPRLSFSSLEWVKAIRDAEFVITDSFHGTVFSILFHKPFYYVITSETVKARISRVYTLLNTLGLKDRIISSIDQCDFQKHIDYNAVQKELDKARSISLNILKKAVSI